jgi:hypothetical protein
VAYYFVDSLFGITTYTVTGAKYGNHLLWFLILLGPVAYYVQDGALERRGYQLRTGGENPPISGGSKFILSVGLN